MLTNGKKIFAFVLIFCLAFCFLTPASAAGEIFVDNAVSGCLGKRMAGILEF